jgi:NAD(P)-dependent dehydrogenase (short-subunit alcohol dehydrogenase family)
MIAEIDDHAARETVEGLLRQGHQVEFRAADVSDPDAVRWLLQETVAAFGGVDILVNNAAIASFPYRANLSELPLEWWRTMMKANLESVLLMSQAAACTMKARGTGCIVNISSITYLLGAAGLSAYQVAKGAMVTLTRSLAIDLAPYGINVNAIAPGWIDTRHNVETMATAEWQASYIGNGRIPLRRAGRPDEIASVALALASGDFSYVTGQTLIADGGLSLTL